MSNLQNCEKNCKITVGRIYKIRAEFAEIPNKYNKFFLNISLNKHNK